jgi:hypothetical protein
VWLARWRVRLWRGRQLDRVRRIGILILGSEADPIQRSWPTVFRDALQQLGWREDRNGRIDLHFAADASGWALRRFSLPTATGS